MPPHYPSKIKYSDKYQDNIYEYRHVTLTADAYARLPEEYRSFYAKLKTNDPYVKSDNH